MAKSNTSFTNSTSGMCGFEIEDQSYQPSKLNLVKTVSDDYFVLGVAVGTKTTCILAVPRNNPDEVNRALKEGCFKEFKAKSDKSYTNMLQSVRKNMARNYEIRNMRFQEDMKNELQGGSDFTNQESSDFDTLDAEDEINESKNPDVLKDALSELGFSKELSTQIEKQNYVSTEILKQSQTDINKEKDQEVLHYMTEDAPRFNEVVNKSEILVKSTEDEGSNWSPLLAEAIQEYFGRVGQDNSQKIMKMIKEANENDEKLKELILADPDSGFSKIGIDPFVIDQLFKQQTTNSREVFVDLVKQGLGKEMHLEILKKTMTKDPLKILTRSQCYCNRLFRMPTNKKKDENFFPIIQDENEKAEEILQNMNGSVMNCKSQLKDLVKKIESYTEQTPDEIFRVV